MSQNSPNVIVTQDGTNHKFAIKRGDQELAHLYVVPLMQRVGCAVLRTGGIAGVWTEREYRHQGWSRHLMSYAVKWMTEMDFDWSGLFGIPNFYTRFGYASAIPEYQLQIATRRAEKAVARHEIRLARLTDDAGDLDAIRRIYDQVNANVTGTIVRDHTRWKGFTKAGGWSSIPEVIVALGNPERGEPEITGYAVHQRYSMHLTIAEIGAINDQSYESILSYYAERAVQNRTETISFMVPSRHALTRICRSLGCTWHVHYSPDADGMWRLLNAQSVFEKLSSDFESRLAQAHLMGTLTIDTGECGAVRLEMGRGGLTISKAEGSSSAPASAREHAASHEQDRVHIDQRIITQLLLGYRHIDEVIYHYGYTDKRQCQWLRALFPETESVFWWPDRF